MVDVHRRKQRSMRISDLVRGRFTSIFSGILILAISIIARYACFRDSVCCVTLYSHGHERR